MKLIETLKYPIKLLYKKRVKQARREVRKIDNNDMKRAEHCSIDIFCMITGTRQEYVDFIKRWEL
jgi:hypothetical protein